MSWLVEHHLEERWSPVDGRWTKRCVGVGVGRWGFGISLRDESCNRGLPAHGVTLQQEGKAGQQELNRCYPMSVRERKSDWQKPMGERQVKAERGGAEQLACGLLVPASAAQALYNKHSSVLRQLKKEARKHTNGEARRRETEQLTVEMHSDIRYLVSIPGTVQRRTNSDLCIHARIRPFRPPRCAEGWACRCNVCISISDYRLTECCA